MLCSSAGQLYPASSGAGYSIHPPAYHQATDAGPHQRHQRLDYSTFGSSAGAAPDGVDYVQDQCSIHSSAALIFPHPPAGSGPPNPQPRKPCHSAGQHSKSAQPRMASGRAPCRSSAAAATPKKRKRVATVAQRRAANVRERRRMFNLNEAFDKLRRKVPTFAYEKRLSRIETLRLAITYIAFMDQVIRNEAATAGPPPPAKSSITLAGGAAPACCEPIATSIPAPEHREAHFRQASVCW